MPRKKKSDAAPEAQSAAEPKSTPTEDRVIETFYDRRNRAVQVTRPAAWNFQASAGAPGGTTFLAGATTINDYDAFGKVIRTRELVNSNTGTYADTYSYYDRRGLKTAQVDALNYLTVYEYDETGDLKRQVEYSRPLTGTPTTLSYGTPTITTSATSPADPAGYDRETLFGYDRLNRKVSETKVGVEYSTVSGSTPGAATGNQVVTFGYDVLGNQTCVTQVGVLVNGTPVDANTYTYYDVLGRVIGIAEPARDRGDSSMVTPLTRLRRDAYGNLVEQTRYYYGAAGTPTESALPAAQGADVNLDRTTRMFLNNHGHAVRTEDANGADRYASYNALGEVAKEWQIVTNSNDASTDALVTLYQYDKLGRRTATVEPQRSGASPVVVTTLVEYNAFGEVTRKGVNGGRQEQFDYDQAGRMWRTNSGDGVFKVYAHNLAGQVTAEIRSQQRNLSTYVSSASAALALPAGEQMRTETRYDLLGRVQERRDPSFTSTTGLESINGGFTIDPSGPTIRWNRPASAVTPKFEYRLAGSTGGYNTRDVQFLAGNQFGVDVAAFAPNTNYEYRVTYARIGEVVAYAQAIGTFRVDGTSGPTLSITQNPIDPASEVATLNTNQGTGALTWTAPADLTVSAKVRIKLSSSSTWTSFDAVRSGGNFVANASTMMEAPGTYSYEITYTRVVDGLPVTIAARSGTLTSTGRSVPRQASVTLVEELPNQYSTFTIDSPTGTAGVSVGAVVVESEYNPYNGSPPPQRWPGTNIVTLNFGNIGAGNLRVELDYTSQSWYTWRSTREGPEEVFHPRESVPNRSFSAYTSDGRSTTISWETSGADGAGGISSIQTVRIYKETSPGSNSYTLVLSQASPPQSYDRSLSWTGSYSSSAEVTASLEIASGGGGYVPVTLTRSGVVFGASLLDKANGTYSYRIIHRYRGRMVAQQTGTLNITSSSVTATPLSNNFYPPIRLPPVSISGETVSWSYAKESAADTIVVDLVGAFGFEDFTKSPSGSNPYSFDFSEVTYPGGKDYTFYIKYFRPGETDPYAMGSAKVRVNISYPVISQVVTITSQAPAYPSGVQPISQPTDGGGQVLRWSTPAEAGAIVEFSYESEPGIWTPRTAGWNGSSFSVDLGAVPVGVYNYRISYRRPADANPYAMTSGRVTVSRSLSVSSVTLSDTTTASQATVVSTPRTQQSLDRWGNAIGVTDAASQTTNYRYNSFDQLSEVRLPTADIVSTYAGGGHDTVNSYSGRAVSRNHYDLHGQLISITDANGNLSTMAYNAAGQVLRETAADTGRKLYIYDAFGQKIQITDERDYRTRQGYDRVGNLKTIAREFNPNAFGATAATVMPSAAAAGVVVDEYQFDEAGRRIAETNGESETTQYFYDLKGNLLRRRTPLGRTTLYEYDANDRRTRETDGNGNSQTWSYNHFGRLGLHTTIGGATLTYAYDGGQSYTGLLTSIVSTVGQNTTYAYDSAGHVVSITDAPNSAQVTAAGLIASARTTTYGYDTAGRRSRESTVIDGLKHQDSRTEYDTLGRIARQSDLRYETTYEYDAVGNRSHVQAAYYDNLAVRQTQDLWYTYDAMNRVRVSQGRNFGGTINIDTSAATHQGVRISYDLAGQRTGISTYDKYIFHRVRTTPGHAGEPPDEIDVYRLLDGVTNEVYAYDGMGRLSTVHKDGFRTVYNQYDKASRETSASLMSVSTNEAERDIEYRQRISVYDNDGFLETQTTRKSGLLESIVTYGTPAPGDYDGFDGAGVLRNYSVAVYDPTTGSNPYRYTTSYTFSYRLGETYQESAQFASSTSGGPQSGSTTRRYTQNGDLYSYTDTKATANNRYFASNAAGQALSVVQGNISNVPAAFASALSPSGTTVKAEHFFYTNDKLIGSFGQLQDSTGKFIANFDVNYTPVSSNYPADTPAQVIVQAGDTLRSIATTVFGDGNLWYLIADANGLAATPDAELTDYLGWALRIPNEVVSLSNTSGSFKPYNISDALGDTTPTQPPPPVPKKKGCGVLGQILVIVVAIVVTVFTAGAAAGAMGVATGVTGTGLGATMAAGAAVLGGAGGLAGFGIAVAAGAIGSAVSQGVAIAAGIQDGFDWKGVALAGIGAGVTAGFGASSSWGKFVKDLGTAGHAVNAAASSTLTQGIGVLTGVQDSFSWRNVATSALAAPVAAKVGGRFAPRTFGRDVASGISGSLVRAAVGGKVDAMSVLMDGFGNALGNSIVDGMRPRGGGASADSVRERNVGGSERDTGASPKFDALGEALNELVAQNQADFDRVLQRDLRQQQFQLSLERDIARGLYSSPDFTENLPRPAAEFDVSTIPRPTVDRDPALALYNTAVLRAQSVLSSRLTDVSIEINNDPATWLQGRAGTPDGAVVVRPDGSQFMQRDGYLKPIANAGGLVEDQQQLWKNMDTAYEAIPFEVRAGKTQLQATADALSVASLAFGAGEVVYALGGLRTVGAALGIVSDSAEYASDIFQGQWGDLGGDATANVGFNILENKLGPAMTVLDLAVDLGQAINEVKPPMLSPRPSRGELQRQMSDREWAIKNGLNPMVVEWGVGTNDERK